MFRPITARMTRWIAGLTGPCAVCVVCSAWPARTFCDACVQRFAQPVRRCRGCAMPVTGGIDRCGACLKNPPPLDACLAAVSYDYPWDRSVAALKFQGQAGLASALGLLLRSAPWVEPLLESTDIVLPLPLSAERLRERGFNQAALLARQLAPARVDTRSLLRIRHTPALSGMDPKTRHASVHGSFAVEPARAHLLAGRRVLLVDDVMTTGATLHEAARTLRRAGAGTVSALVVARTPLD